MPCGLFPSNGEHDHHIFVVQGSQLLNVHPYKHLLHKKNEIENINQELLEVGIIYHSTNPYASHVVMVLKIQGNWYMCLDFWFSNKLTVQGKNSYSSNR